MVKMMEELYGEVTALRESMLVTTAGKGEGSAGKTEGDKVLSYRDATVGRKEVIIVKSKEKKAHKEVKKDLASKVDPVSLNMDISISRKIKDGDVVLECRNADEPEKLRRQIESKVGDGYEVKSSKKVYPKMKIVNIPEEVNKECTEIRDKILCQNGIQSGRSNFHLEVFHLTRGNKEYFSALIEVDMETFEILQRRERINIGLNRCRVFEFINVLKCYRCQGYSHFAKDCREEKDCCPRCGGEHNEKQCKERVFRCVNCVKANAKFGLQLNTEHAVWDRDCSCLKRIEEQIRKRTTFSGL